MFLHLPPFPSRCATRVRVLSNPMMKSVIAGATIVVPSRNGRRAQVWMLSVRLCR